MENLTINKAKGRICWDIMKQTGYYENPSTNRFENLNEIGKFLKQNPLKLT